METWTINDRDLDTQIKQARKAGAASLKNEPRAKSARYVATRRQVVVELTNGCIPFMSYNLFVFGDFGLGKPNMLLAPDLKSRMFATRSVKRSP
jgi:hypothetical protein